MINKPIRKSEIESGRYAATTASDFIVISCTRKYDSATKIADIRTDIRILTYGFSSVLTSSFIFCVTNVSTLGIIMALIASVRAAAMYISHIPVTYAMIAVTEERAIAWYR